MAYYDTVESRNGRSPRPNRGLPVIAVAVATIVAIGALGQIAGDWTDAAATRMTQSGDASSKITDWHGNSAHLPGAR